MKKVKTNLRRKILVNINPSEIVCSTCACGCSCHRSRVEEKSLKVSSKIKQAS